MIKRLVILAFAALATVSSAQAADDWVTRIRPDHPRLFFNDDTWPAVKARALGPERAWFDGMQRRVDGYPDNPTTESTRDDFAYKVLPDGSTETITVPRPTEWGIAAAYTAFVYRVTGDKAYLDKAKKMLDTSVRAYHECYDKRMTVNWYSRSRVHWLAAWDWLYDDLPSAERTRLMKSFLAHVDSIHPRPDRPPLYRLNDSGHTTGFYGDRNLFWFTGLAAYREGIDDADALRLLTEGYKYNIDMFEYRKWCAGDDGGLASASPNYALGAYPWAQFNFLYTWRSATGENIAADWPHLAYFPVWTGWNWLPGPVPREFGTGDSYHYDNALTTSYLYMHMSQIMDFYGSSHPECAALAAYLRDKLPENRRRYSWAYGFYPFLMTDIDKAPPPADPKDSGIYARHFETLGEVFMRSGTGDDDTYCLYTIGSRVPSHKQHDENNFIIYRSGYLALDSGTRGRETGHQLRHYYSQTVAHNCMLIHMPGEPFPGYWGLAYDGPEGQLSAGGTYKTNEGDCAAFETNDVYTYVAGDATRCYLPAKCNLALRQMVFLMPDIYVICDRVTSTDPSYRKDWLLHTQNEPTVIDNAFFADQENGRLWCRTVLPANAELRKVGGPDKRFWAAGKNWVLAPEVEKQWGEKGLLGNWRMEISPGEPRTDDVFLHVIHVGPNEGFPAMVPTQAVDEDGVAGVRLAWKGMTTKVTFATDGPAAGHITVTRDELVVTDRDLAETVMSQVGLAGK